MTSSHSYPFREDNIEIFPTPVRCWVIQAIRPDGFGRVKIAGDVPWRAELYLPDCSNTLLAGQPALAIGRRNNILIITPYQSLLWPDVLSA